jgi:hypothetical protein
LTDDDSSAKLDRVEAGVDESVLVVALGLVCWFFSCWPVGFRDKGAGDGVRERMLAAAWKANKYRYTISMAKRMSYTMLDKITGLSSKQQARTCTGPWRDDATPACSSDSTCEMEGVGTSFLRHGRFEVPTKSSLATIGLDSGIEELYKPVLSLRARRISRTGVSLADFDSSTLVVEAADVGLEPRRLRRAFGDFETATAKYKSKPCAWRP